MPKKRGGGRPATYHHGDLKAALVAHALDLLRTGGLPALTLRAVARAAGVSEAAPYRHFANRRELMAAAAEEGFARMHAAMVERMSARPGAEGFKGVAIAYVEFALANPAQYRVMFGPELAHTEDLPSLRATSRGVLAFVATGIEQLQAAGIVAPGDSSAMAVVVWATLHGLVTLALDGTSEDVAPPMTTLVDEATRIIMFGMARRGEPLAFPA